jgi:TusA-related sulfurtransferase
MIISANTKISKLIKENELAIDAIADINPHFKKLKNPILRRVLAPRVNIETAARIGGVDIQVFFDKLAKIGFEVDKKAETTKQQIETINKTDNMFDLKNDKITVLDVREGLANGIDPFNEIMAAIKDFTDGEVLKIVNTFEPTPIINVLKQKGFISKVEHISENEIHTYLKKEQEDKSEEINQKAQESAKTDDIDTVFASFKEKFKELDVRDLEMPQPMVTILEELKDLPEDHCLYVHHKKVPQFLLPQLDERGYVYLSKEIDGDNTKMLIFKKIH